MDAAPKTKGHVKALMHRLSEMAMIWELFPVVRNPMGLVEAKGISRRVKKPLTLEAEQCWALVSLLPDSPTAPWCSSPSVWGCA